MKVGLFIPCYVDAVFPDAALATYKLLRHLGVDVTYPTGQTCCGQPMANAGFEQEAEPLARKYRDMFAGFDYVVYPVGVVHCLYSASIPPPVRRE